MAARVDELCDAAKTVIETAATANPLAGTTIVVTTEDVPDIDADDMPAGTLYVWIWWESYQDGGPAARGIDNTDYLLRFLAVQRFGESGQPTQAWRRARTEWVDTCIVRALGDARDRLDGAYAMTLEEVLYDQDELLERKMFWTRVAITIRDERTA